MSKPKNIEEKAQLLSGIGASAWFYICREKENYRIKRYSAKGELECSEVFYVDDPTFNINKQFRFTYISHCKQCVILQENKKYIFNT